MLLIGLLSPHPSMEHLLSAAAQNLTTRTVSKKAPSLILNMRQQSAQAHLLILFMITRYIELLPKYGYASFSLIYFMWLSVRQ